MTDPRDTSLTQTTDPRYSHRLIQEEGRAWKRLLNVQMPYRWNIRRLNPGYTLDIGCGVGRNLAHLDGFGVGVDHNETSIAEAKRRGINALTSSEFEASTLNRPGTFDSLLLAHVLEHMNFQDAVALVREKLPLIKEGGKVILITPQQKGFRSDPTHIEDMPLQKLEALGAQLGLLPAKSYSFPFPRFVGRFFTHNENVYVGTLPGKNKWP